MDRRFFIWLMLTSSLFFLYLSFQPPPPKPQAQEAAEPVPGQVEDPLLAEKGSQDEGGQEGSQDAGEIGSDPKRTEDQQANPEQAEKPADFAAQAVTIGSMDPNKNYNLLITLSSQGASIERAEMVAQDSPGKFRYIALEHNAGYLGYLGVVETVEGLKVRVVPDGSPAALAKAPAIEGGLVVGDIIYELNGNPTLSREQFEQILRKTRPGESAVVKIYRDQRPIEFQVLLSQAPMDILRSQAFSSEIVSGNQDLNSFRTTLATLNATRVPAGKAAIPALRPTLEKDWKVVPLAVPGGDGVEFRYPMNHCLRDTDTPQLELVKRYRLYPASESNDGFLLDLETAVENQNQESVSLSLRQEGPTGLSLEGWWYSVKISQSFFTGAGQRDVAYADQSGVHLLKTTRDIFSFAQKNPSLPQSMLFSEGEPLEHRTLNYIGLDSQYFNASMLPHPDQPDGLADLAQAGARIVGDVSAINSAQIQAANVAFWLDTKPKTVEPNQSLVQRYSVFLGPKDSQILAGHGLDRTIEYGWFPWIAKPLGWLLHFFHAIVRNYGLAIIMLTVCVRLAMFPLGRRAAITAQRMQELQPEIKKINEKYPDNMEKRARAMQELYRKHDFKPLAGCLPLFIQLPIFIGLYRCLSVDISLRQEPLIPGLTWCSNLAGPDQFYDWSGWMWEYLAGRGTGWLGPYFNILPMVTVLLFLLQQQMMMPKAADPQTQMTQTMMKYMTVFMGVIFFKVPAGLCIYFITSSIWSLFERQLVKRTIPPPNLAGATAVASPTPELPTSPKSKPPPRTRGQQEPPATGPMSQWRKLLDQTSVRSGTQRGTKKTKRRKP